MLELSGIRPTQRDLRADSALFPTGAGLICARRAFVRLRNAALAYRHDPAFRPRPLRRHHRHPPAAALRNSIDLARHVDGLGYVRYWLAEHHNLASVASPAPDLMIGQIAAVTKNIRVGSGGVMLPNHAPLVVAERFKMLEALFPGRIDLGLGRAPGTDGATAHALRSRLDRRDGDDFLERLQELMLWETRDFPAGHPYNNVVAMPDDTPLPPIWLLGSSDYSFGTGRAGRHGLRVRASFRVAMTRSRR